MGWGWGGGSRCAHGGENGEFTPIPWPPSLPSASPTASFGRCKPPLREQPSRSSPGRLPAPLPLAPLRFSGPALAAHLPPAIEMEAAAAGKRHAAPHHPPTHPPTAARPGSGCRVVVVVGEGHTEMPGTANPGLLLGTTSAKVAGGHDETQRARPRAPFCQPPRCPHPGKVPSPWCWHRPPHAPQ